MTPRSHGSARSPKRPRLVTAGLLGGGAAGLLLLAPTLADAASPLAEALGQTTPPTTEPTAEDTDADTADTGDAADTGDDGAELAVAEPADHIRELLQPLVDDGTLTAEQVDAIVESVQAAVPDVFVVRPGRPGHGRPHGQFPDVMGGPGVPGFPGGGGIDIHAGGPGISVEIGGGIGPGMFPVGPYALDLVANTIGISAPDLLDQLADGATVAEIATAAGADPQTVIDALVADVQERLAAAVQSGRITQAEADERAETATERITAFVEGEQPSTGDEGTDPETEVPATEPAATTETTSA